GVDVVVGAVNQLGLHVDHRITREYTTLESFAHALFCRLDELTRDHATNDFVLEDESFALLRRLNVDDYVTVLALTARLADEFSFDLLDALANRLAVNNLGASVFGVCIEILVHAVEDNLD